MNKRTKAESGKAENLEIFNKNRLIDQEISLMRTKCEHGMMSAEELQGNIQKMEEIRKDLVRAIHKYSIKPYTAKDGKGRKDRTRWSTRLPDDTKACGYRWLRANDEDSLYQLLFEYYGLKEPTHIRKPSATSLEGLYNRWIEYRLAKVRPGTVKKDQAIWNRFYKGDPITKKPLDAIRPSEAFLWLSNMVTSRHLTRRQYTEMRGIWSRIEGFAYNDDLISKRLMRNVESPERNLFADEKPRYKEEAAFTISEIHQLSEKASELYALSHFNTAYLGLMLDPYIGFRVGELSCLRWDCIDFNKKTITIKQAEAPKYVVENGEIHNRGYEIIDHLKCHHKERIVPLPPEAESVLNRIRKENMKHGVISEYVFVQKSGERVHTRAFHKALKNVYKELGWNNKIGGIHECRRTYATSLIGKIDDKDVQMWMGHKDWTTTKRYYQYSSQEPDPSAAEAVSRAFREA